MNNNEVVNIEIADGIITPEVTNVFVPIGGGGHVDLEPYATKADTYTKAEVDDKVNGVHVDLSNYYNKGEVDSKVQAVTPDLSTYATKAEVDAKVSTATGQKGDPGPKGDKGDPFTYSDFTTEQLEGLKGPKGDKGEPGERGQDGAVPEVTQASNALKKLNYYNNGNLNDILTTIINHSIQPKTAASLQVIQPQKGDTTLAITGESHYKVAVQGEELVEIIDGKATLLIPTYGSDDISIDYYNMVGDKVSTSTVAGIKALSFTDKNGITVSKEGDVLTVDLTNQTDGIDKHYDISDRPSWAYDGTNNIKFMSNKPNRIIGYAETDKILLDKLYATLNQVTNTGISDIYFQYGEASHRLFVPIMQYIAPQGRLINRQLPVDEHTKKHAVRIANPVGGTQTLYYIGQWYKLTDDVD